LPPRSTQPTPSGGSIDPPLSFWKKASQVLLSSRHSFTEPVKVPVPSSSATAVMRTRPARGEGIRIGKSSNSPGPRSPMG
jgi:hypothetical protein